MSKKMIECLECHGRGWFVTSIGSINECAKCGTAGRIPDRRKPSEIEDALRAEVAKYRGMEVENAGLKTDNKAYIERIAELLDKITALKAELAKRDEPLTDEQAELAFAIAKENGVGECDTLAHGVQGIDAAIRRVRKGE